MKPKLKCLKCGCEEIVLEHPDGLMERLEVRRKKLFGEELLERMK